MRLTEEDQVCSLSSLKILFLAVGGVESLSTLSLRLDSESSIDRRIVSSSSGRLSFSNLDSS